MGHTAETRKRAYEKIKQCRNRWFQAHGPCVLCGSWEKLELDHIDPSTKVSHRVWSWSENRRAEELLKCQILCEACHMSKTREQLKLENTGIPCYGRRKISDEEIVCAKKLRAEGLLLREVATFFNVSASTLSVLTRRSTLKSRQLGT